MESLSELSVEQRHIVDRLADEFEAELRAGQRPSIENMLAANPAFRTHLLTELLAIEIELRRVTGESPTVEEYKQRFPDDHSLVEAVFHPATDLSSTADQPQDTEVEEELQPKQLDRYIIQRQLGRGGFGTVYLAHDPHLDRPVALKIPRRERFKTEQQVTSFMEEARTAAKLKHAGLVGVYDVREERGLPYIVQEYIDGSNLSQWAAKHQPSFEHIAKVLLGITDAIGYAHQQGLTHCDLKLANVLVDSDGKPHVADFGLAVHENKQTVRKGEVFGTPAMMAPEQVRGEGHRLDGRTDIWAIGVMLYELLGGRRPFKGNTQQDLFNEILTLDPRPLREIDRSTPKELERICFKCLSKKRTERYSTTDDLREDLDAWLSGEASTQVPQSSTVGKTNNVAPSVPDSSSGSKPPAKIIPRGLRSFDADDADFFLDLLPGPRDRDGLPESIRFWKKRIEEPDADKTFSVGLIYGPSGCGKSSLVKAGLLPRLAESVLPIYVEATAADTEVRILKQLRKHIPRLPVDVSLVDACAELRLTGAGRSRKMLLVIDQFEQWLHSHSEFKQAQLVDALRQCEGARLQAVLLVRDDFFASVHRLFQELEQSLIDGNNYALIDRFDKEHACKVLVGFGRAYNKLGDALNSSEQNFVSRAVDELAEDGKVISVRLSLFADMMKSRPWIPASLQEVGGVRGVGVTFLEETFSAKTAPPAHRVHEQAIRKILRALLPEAGTDIKGGMRSEVVLREAAEFQDDHKRFEELVRILDAELRIITPTEPDGEKFEVGSKKFEERTSDFSIQTSNFYQLTHDYLVPSVREWLTRKQRETRKGRAELKLEERTALWSAKQENRFLPSLLEWITIRCLTSPKSWNELQRTVMRKAARVHLAMWGSVAMVVVLFGISIQQFLMSENLKLLKDKTANAVHTIRSNSGSAIPIALGNLKLLPPNIVQDELRARFAEAKGQQKLSLAYGLASIGQIEFDAIVAGIIDRDTQGAEVANIVRALNEKDTSAQALPKIQTAAQSATVAKDWKAKARLAIVAMYLGDLGDLSIAEEMLRAEPVESAPQPWDPVQRTEFIAEFPEWCGELGRLAERIESSSNAALRSGISLAVGSVDRADEASKDVWRRAFENWYTRESDAGSHNAASWALRHWGFKPPTIEPTAQPSSNRAWWHTPVKLTMVRIPVGSVRTAVSPISVKAPFWLSDREISIELFKRFMAEAKLKPNDDQWRGASAFENKIDDTHPMQQVNWEDAVMFCNWLSEKHGLNKCYQIEPLTDPRKSESGIRTLQRFNVKLLRTDGFRLPTADEWEYACRARTTTDFSSGDDEERLKKYAVFGASRTNMCGSKLCNPWGLYDMHGNIDEWCWDAEGSYWVDRGGSWNYLSRRCHSSYRSSETPTSRYDELGFRVAQGPLAPEAASGAESAGR